MKNACPLYTRCGGCELQSLSYTKQLEYKQHLLEQKLSKFQVVAPIVGMKDPSHYRNKVQAVFGRDNKKQIISGIYRRGTHQIVPVRDCLLEDKKCDQILSTIRKLVKTLGIMVYDEDAHTGFLRHVLIKRSEATGQVMVVLVAGSFNFKQSKEFVGNLINIHPEITSVLLNKNNEDTSMVLSQEPEILLYGKPFIEDVLLNLTFRISAKSFYQVNHSQAQKLYKIAINMARLDGTQNVIDAYCGTGTIAQIAATNGAKSVLGIELNPDAVEDAIQNSIANNITNVQFVCADASVFLKDLSKQNAIAKSSKQQTQIFEPDIVILDPPRSGSTEQFLSALIRLNPQKIIYISCNPDTLERDLRYLVTNSTYTVKGIQGVDMFPHTPHIETVVLLTK